MDKSLSGIRERISQDLITEEHECAGGTNGRCIHGLEDYTLHDLVRVARVANEEYGRRVELVAHEGTVFWALAREGQP